MSVTSASTIFDRAYDYLNAHSPSPYEHQVEAVMELSSGSNVILTSPTGSGKSLVAEAAIAGFLATRPGFRAVWTAPIKALVNEQFNRLCERFGASTVGIATGDVSVRPDAQVVCCTAEILANRALRSSSERPADLVVMDEFHYYSDPQRGWAWQVPLLELPDSQFLLMSATIGRTERFRSDLERRTRRQTTVVTAAERPVPLTFDYLVETLDKAVPKLLEDGRAPIYVVHSSQNAAFESAQRLASALPKLGVDKDRIRAEIDRVRFDTPFGQRLHGYLLKGIAIHHAGLLPRYRLVVERLAQQGLLRIICGTDTLGVGINVPIRSVLFVELAKWDGTKRRMLRNREFHQIAGRAGRRGFDERGHVYALAHPRDLVGGPPGAWTGQIVWNEQSFRRLEGGEPEPLDSRFDVSAQMVMCLLDRPARRGADGRVIRPIRHFRRLLLQNHEPPSRQRRHMNKAKAIYRTLRAQGIVEILGEPDDLGRLVRVKYSLQDEYTLHKPLSMFIQEFLAQRDPLTTSDYPLLVLACAEASVDEPRKVLKSRSDRARTAEYERLRREKVPYDERQLLMKEFRLAVALEDELLPAYEAYAASHHWLQGIELQPKDVVREIYLGAYTFRDYVDMYKLAASEGELLRYLTDVYKAMVQAVPETSKDDAVRELQEWLGDFARQVDSSLLDEWSAMQESEVEVLGKVSSGEDAHGASALPSAFRVMVRNAVFRWVRLLGAANYGALASCSAQGPDGQGVLREGDLKRRFKSFVDAHGDVDATPAARDGELYSYDQSTQVVRQILIDPDDSREWQLIGRVDLDASRQAGDAVVLLEQAGHLPTML